MDLVRKSDWGEAKERYRAWWAHEVLDRCAIAVTAPKANLPREAPPRLLTGIEDRWLDFDYLAAWFPLWSPGTFYAAQNDFSYMISPRMFRDVFLPVIEMQIEFLDHSIYHVDGVGAFAHVDALWELPSLRALQILPGDGNPSPLHYMDVLRKVQRARKNLHITIAPNEIETALRELSIRGLFIETWCNSEEEARDLLRNVAVWSRDR